MFDIYLPACFASFIIIIIIIINHKKRDETRRVFVETSMSWAGSDTGRHRASISERKVSWHVCVSGSSVGQSAGLVACNCMVPGSALIGILAYFLLCAGLPSFV